MRQESGTGRPRDLGKGRVRCITIALVTLAVIILIAGCVGAQQPNVVAAPPNVPETLVGVWLGPMPGDTGKCGKSFSEFVFRQDSSYSVTSNSRDCGGFTTYGVYEVRNDLIDFHQRGASPGLPQRMEISVKYRFDGPNALMLQDAPSRWFTYHRQR